MRLANLTNGKSKNINLSPWYSFAAAVKLHYINIADEHASSYWGERCRCAGYMMLQKAKCFIISWISLYWSSLYRGLTVYGVPRCLEVLKWNCVFVCTTIVSISPTAVMIFQFLYTAYDNAFASQFSFCWNGWPIFCTHCTRKRNPLRYMQEPRLIALKLMSVI